MIAENDLLFKCDCCGNPFVADSDSMITVEMAIYILPRNVDSSVQSFLNKSSIDKQIPNTDNIIVYAPKEFSNIGVCACEACRLKNNG